MAATELAFRAYGVQRRRRGRASPAEGDWIVPGFTVDRYRHRLAELHDRIQADGPFVAHAQRFLVEARKPA